LFAEVVRKNILFPQEAHVWADVFFGDDLQFTHEQMDVLKEAGDVFFIEAVQSAKKHGMDIKNICDDLKIKLNLSGKKLFMPLRVALTGEQNGPELAHIANLLGSEKIMRHLNHVLELVRK